MSNRKIYLNFKDYKKEISNYINDNERNKIEIEKLNKAPNGRDVIVNDKVYRYNETKPVSKSLRLALIKNKYVRISMKREKQMKEERQRFKDLDKQTRRLKKDIENMDKKVELINQYRPLDDNIKISIRSSIPSKRIKDYNLDNKVSITNIRDIGYDGLNHIYNKRVVNEVKKFINKSGASQKIIIRGRGLFVK